MITINTSFISGVRDYSTQDKNVDFRLLNIKEMYDTIIASTGASPTIFSFYPSTINDYFMSTRTYTKNEETVNGYIKLNFNSDVFVNWNTDLINLARSPLYQNACGFSSKITMAELKSYCTKKFAERNGIETPGTIYMASFPYGIPTGATSFSLDNYFDTSAIQKYKDLSNTVIDNTSEYYDLKTFYGLNDEENLTNAQIQAYMLFIGISLKKEENKFTFDVYLDGKEESNIGINWNCEKHANAWSGQLTTPEIYFYTENWQHVTTEINNVISPNTNIKLQSHYEMKYDVGKLDTSYLKELDIMGCDDLSPLDKVLHFGVNGKPENIYLFLRFKYEYFTNETLEKTTTYSTLHQVIIPRKLPETPEEIEIYNIKDNNTNEWVTHVTVHFGETPEENDARHEHSSDISGKNKGKYDANNIPNPSDFTNGTGTETSGILTTTYALSTEKLKNVGQKLWSQSYFDVLKIQTNPIENIVSCKAFPLNLTGAEEDIIIGNISFGINGYKRSSNILLDIGSIEINEKYHNFLDYAPFTKLTLYLPYIGFHAIDTSQFMSTTLSIRYAIDLITGACKCFVSSDNICMYELDGTIGIDIPLTSTDRAQTDIKHLQNAINTGAGLVNGDILGSVNCALSGATAQYTSNTTSNGSPSCSAFSCRTCYIIYDRPLQQIPASFNHNYGRKCNLTKRIGDLSGYTELLEIDMSSIPCTQTERDELLQILKTGFII